MPIGLNPAQMQAVEHGDGPLLVLAGAGTGKTRVLVNRIAHLVETGVEPWTILAVTFTNKAAGEMRERLGHMLGDRARPMWIGTFHSTCARLLRKWAQYAGLTSSFTIFDDDDQLKLINRLLKDGGFDDALSPRSVLSRIDRAKNKGVSPIATPTGHYADDILAVVYPRYQAQLARENAVDFNDLLLKVLELTTHPEVGPVLAQQFSHVLVDEFQDTNLVQYELVRRLSAATRNLTVVGDDDQAIYGWRGAVARNILDFHRDFPDLVEIKLEQNYRSTQVILDAANAVIERNRERRGKALWTEQRGGDGIITYEAGDERGEGAWAAGVVRQLLDEGPWSPQDFAILYRTNAQSRVLEEHLRARNIPAKVVGAVSFFERKEIKDVLAYLRLLHHDGADSAFARVVNVPARGIGDSTVEKLRNYALAIETSVFEATRRVVRGGELASLGAGPRKKLAGFVQLMDGLREVMTSGASVAEVIVQVVERSGMRQRLEEDGSPESQDRIKNLSELLNTATDFDDELGEQSTVTQFLERIALTAAADQTGTGKDGQGKKVELPGGALTLMTVHVAKGLEYPIVIICGLEDGLFPSLREREDQDEAAGLEEERRLAYVAITRAKERLYLTSARTRRVWGEMKIQQPSRFLLDIPVACLAAPRRAARPVPLPPVRPKPYDEFDQRAPGDDDEVPLFRADAAGAAAGSGPLVAATTRVVLDDDGGYHRGDRVVHDAFGPGRVVETSGEGKEARALVEFASVGRKMVLLRWLSTG